MRRHAPRVWAPRRPRPALLRPVAMWFAPLLLVLGAASLLVVATPQVSDADASDTPYTVSGHARAPAESAAPSPVAPAGSDPIDVKYQQLGGSNGQLGAPAGDELLLPGRGGKFRVYNNGVIVWTPGLGAQTVDLASLAAQIPGSDLSDLLQATPTTTTAVATTPATTTPAATTSGTTTSGTTTSVTVTPATGAGE